MTRQKSLSGNGDVKSLGLNGVDPQLELMQNIPSLHGNHSSRSQFVVVVVVVANCLCAWFGFYVCFSLFHVIERY